MSSKKTKCIDGHNQTLYFGRDFPAIKSTDSATTGRSSNGPIYGSCLATVKTVGRKLPNKFKNPKASKQSPTIQYRIKTKPTPRKKQNVPRILSLLQCVVVMK